MSSDHVRDPGRELHPAEWLVVRKGNRNRHVAHHRIGQCGVDTFDQVLCVEKASERTAIRRHEAHGGAVALTSHGGLVGFRGLDEPWRRQPDLHVPPVGEPAPHERLEQRRARRRRAAAHVPCVVAVDEPDLLGAAKRRAFRARPERPCLAHGWRGVVNIGHHPLHGVIRPRPVWCVSGPEHRQRSAALVAKRRHARHSHRRFGRVQCGARGVASSLTGNREPGEQNEHPGHWSHNTRLRNT